MDKNDINLMHLKDTKSSKKDGNVFGTLKGVKDFHAFGEYPIEVLEGKTLNELTQMFVQYQKDANERFEIIVTVLKHQKDKIKELEGKLEKYGL